MPSLLLLLALGTPEVLLVEPQAGFAGRLGVRSGPGAPYRFAGPGEPVRVRALDEVLRAEAALGHGIRRHRVAVDEARLEAALVDATDLPTLAEALDRASSGALRAASGESSEAERILASRSGLDYCRVDLGLSSSRFEPQSGWFRRDEPDRVAAWLAAAGLVTRSWRETPPPERAPPRAWPWLLPVGALGLLVLGLALFAPRGLRELISGLAVAFALATPFGDGGRPLVWGAVLALALGAHVRWARLPLGGLCLLGLDEGAGLMAGVVLVAAGLAPGSACPPSPAEAELPP